MIKTYRGNQTYAINCFRYDAEAMASKGYVPTSQVWVGGKYGCGAFLLALILCFLIVGIFIFLYMLIVPPDGVLTVTYEYRGAPRAKNIEVQRSNPPIAPDRSITVSDLIARLTPNQKLAAFAFLAFVSLMWILGPPKQAQSEKSNLTKINKAKIKQNTKQFVPENKTKQPGHYAKPSFSEWTNSLRARGDNLIVIGKSYTLGSHVASYRVPAANYSPTNVIYEGRTLPEGTTVLVTGRGEESGTTYILVSCKAIMSEGQVVQTNTTGWISEVDLLQAIYSFGM